MDATPRPVDGVDVKALPIGPEEAYVLSRIDGHTSVEQIALSTGLGRDRVRQALAALVRCGAVVVSHPSPTTESDRAGAPVVSSPMPPAGEAPSYDPRELDEPADLTPERKHAILDAFHRLENDSHYDLLGVATDADKATIKLAYFELVNVFHPDRYYGKNLGTFKQKLARVFQQITLAHDTLTRKKSREEYDRYLASQRATRAFDRSTEDGVHRAEAEIEAIRRDIQREASDPRARESPPPSEPPVAARVVTPEERRRAFARKIRGSGPPRRIGSPEASDRATQKAAAEDLRRRYADRVVRAVEERVKRYVAQADASEREGHWVAAMNALRIAQSLTPNDEALKARLEQTDAKASAMLHKQYLEQAQYEERQGSYLSAARSYERALKSTPDSAALNERTAHCYLEANEDLKRAGILARRAVELAPKDTAYRITLARIYERAGMTQSALGELERAKTLDPSDDTIKSWLKRFKRGQD